MTVAPFVFIYFRDRILFYAIFAILSISAAEELTPVVAALNLTLSRCFRLGRCALVLNKRCVNRECVNGIIGVDPAKLKL